MFSVAIFCVLTWTACLMTVCLGYTQIQPEGPSQGNPAKTGLSSTNNANPSLLLTLLNGVSSSASNPSPPGPTAPVVPTQTNTQTGGPARFALESTKQSSPSVPQLPFSPPYQTPGPYPPYRTPSTKHMSAQFLTPNSLNQQYLRDKALLSSYQHAPYHIALAKGASVSRAEQAAKANKLMEMYVLIASAKSLECKTAGELLIGEDMASIPVSCTGRCPRGTSCKTIGPFGFCCPRRVTNLQIKMNAIFGPLTL